MQITNVNDYVCKLKEQFPEMPEKDLKRILVYGWKQIIQYTSAGNDISMLSPKEFLFIGTIPVSGLATFKRYCYKLSKRIAYMFHRKKEKWDGYYYFSLNDFQYADYLKQSKKKIKIFKNIHIYKLLEEVRIKNYSDKYIFRLKEDKTGWMNKFYKEIKTKNAELIIVRDCLNMKDVLTSENKFKYIS